MLYLYTKLKYNTRMFAAKLDSLPKYQYSDTIKQIKELNFFSYFTGAETQLRKELSEIRASQLQSFLHCLCAELLHEENALDILERLAPLLPSVSFQDAHVKMKGLMKQAEYYLSMNKEISPSLKASLSSIFDSFIALIEAIITAFGIGGLCKPAESEVHASFKSQQLMMILQLFIMIATLILPILGAQEGAMIIGGTFLGIAILSLIFPKIRPIPLHLPMNGENWTKQIEKGASIPEGRQETLDEAANILKRGRHALFIGPSRVGKSLTAKALTAAIARGDYPELEGMVVYRLNAPDFINQGASFLGGGNDVLQKISDAMGRHRDKIILVIDEFHMLCKDKVGDQLLLYLDKGGEFPHVIGITTDSQYGEFVQKNRALDLRFDKVVVKNTNESETVRILGNMALKSPLKPLLGENALRTIVTESSKENAPQPASAIRLLEKCINKTQATELSRTEKNIIEKKNQILSLQSEAAASLCVGTISDKISQLERDLLQLQTKLKIEEQEKQRVYAAKNLMNKTIEKVYRLSLTSNQFSHFALLEQFLKPQLLKFLHSSTVVIDESLIKSQVAE